MYTARSFTNLEEKIMGIVVTKGEDIKLFKSLGIHELTILPESELRDLTFLRHGPPLEGSHQLLFSSMERTFPYANKKIGLHKFEMQISCDIFSSLGEEFSFTDFEKSRTVLATLIFNQYDGQDGVLATDGNYNRLFIDSVEGICTATLQWKADSGWQIFFQNYFQAEPKDIFFLETPEVIK